MLGHFSHKNRFKNALKIWFELGCDFQSIWGRFWKSLGTHWEVFRPTLGSAGRVLERSSGSLWSRTDSNGRLGTILDDFGSNLEGFELHLGRFCSIYVEDFRPILRVYIYIYTRVSGLLGQGSG